MSTRPGNVVPPSETDRAYTAGIIDGEGSLVYGIRALKQKTGTYLSIQAVIQVAMCDEIVTRWLHETWGGLYFKEPRRSASQPQWHDAWRWSVTKTSEVLRVLLTVRPYLKLKAPKADGMIEYCRSRAGVMQRPVRERRFTEREMELAGVTATHLARVEAARRARPPLQRTGPRGGYRAQDRH